MDVPERRPRLRPRRRQDRDLPRSHEANSEQSYRTNLSSRRQSPEDNIQPHLDRDRSRSPGRGSRQEDDSQRQDDNAPSRQSPRSTGRDVLDQNQHVAVGQSGNSQRSLVSSALSNKRRSIYIEAAEQRASIKRRMLEQRETIELDLVNEKLAARLREADGSVVDSQESNSIRGGRSVESNHSLLRNDDRMGTQHVANWVNSVASEWAQPNSQFPAHNSQNNEPPASIRLPADPRLSDVLIATMKTLQEVSASGNNSNRLVNRLTTAKGLPPFSGDSLEWVRFKQAFEASSKLGAYSEAENVMRLYDALNGTAKEAVESLMVTRIWFEK